MTKLTFAVWKMKVDSALDKLTGGLTSIDLPDVDYYGMYESGMSSIEAAREARTQAEFF